MQGFEALSSERSTYISNWPNRIFKRYNSLKTVGWFFEIIVEWNTRRFLQKIYIYIYSSPDLKKKTIKGKIAVNIQRLIRIADHSVITELKNIINHSRYCKGSWLLLALQSHLWYVVENIYSKSKK